MSMGLSVFKQEPGTGNLEFVTATPLSNQRQALIDIELMPGRYYLVPRTSGVGFQKPLDARKEGKIPIFKKSGEISELVITTLRDIFRRLDKIHLGGCLGLTEFNTLLKKAATSEETSMTSDFFKYNVLAKYAHNSQNEINIRGFLDWFKDWIQSKGV